MIEDRSEVKFAIAKYMPCLERQEPRNIGVMVWRNGKALWKFFDKKPKFVTSKHAYDQWLEYWQELVSRGKVTGFKEKGERFKRIDVEIKDDRFVEAVCQMETTGNYVCCEAGSLWPNEGASRDLAKIADELFARLVA